MTITITAEDFRTVHNTLCELRGLAQRMHHSMVKVNDIEDIIEGFEQGLKGAYQQENQDFDSKMDYYHRFQKENGLRAIWSIYELPVHGFLDRHPFLSDSFVVYRDHWGDGPARARHYPVMGTTWADLYRAADLAIQESGDGHHIFIEQFRVVNGNELHLQTGS